MTPFQHFKLSVQKKEAKNCTKDIVSPCTWIEYMIKGKGLICGEFCMLRVVSHTQATGTMISNDFFIFFSVLSYPALSNHRETCCVLIPNYNQIEPQLPHCALSEILSWPCINFAHHLMWSHQDFRQCRDLDLFTDHIQLQTTNHLWKHQALLSPVHIPKHKSLTDLSCWYRKS